MRKATTLLLLLSLSTMLAGQSVAQNDNGSVEGTVTTLRTGEPLSDVQVQLGNYAATTNTSGHFTINDMPPAAYNVMIKRSGYVVAGQGPSIGNNSASVGRITLGPKE